MAITRSQSRGGAALTRMNDRIGRRRRARQAIQQYQKRYRPNDTHHRHRIDDDQPKRTRVVSYTRRN